MTIYDLLNDGELASVVIGRQRFIPPPPKPGRRRTATRAMLGAYQKA